MAHGNGRRRESPRLEELNKPAVLMFTAKRATSNRCVHITSLDSKRRRARNSGGRRQIINHKKLNPTEKPRTRAQKPGRCQSSYGGKSAVGGKIIPGSEARRLRPIGTPEGDCRKCEQQPSSGFRGRRRGAQSQKKMAVEKRMAAITAAGTTPLRAIVFDCWRPGAHSAFPAQLNLARLCRQATVLGRAQTGRTKWESSQRLSAEKKIPGRGWTRC